MAALNNALDSEAEEEKKVPVVEAEPVVEEIVDVEIKTPGSKMAF